MGAIVQWILAQRMKQEERVREKVSVLRGGSVESESEIGSTVRSVDTTSIRAKGAPFEFQPVARGLSLG